MQLIKRSEFENLQKNDSHGYEVDKNGAKETLKIYSGEEMIAKRITHKKSVRYFGVKSYMKYITED
jgi:hypothetical protein